MTNQTANLDNVSLVRPLRPGLLALLKRGFNPGDHLLGRLRHWTLRIKAHRLLKLLQRGWSIALAQQDIAE